MVRANGMVPWRSPDTKINHSAWQFSLLLHPLQNFVGLVADERELEISKQSGALAYISSAQMQTPCQNWIQRKPKLSENEAHSSSSVLVRWQGHCWYQKVTIDQITGGFSIIVTVVQPSLIQLQEKTEWTASCPAREQRLIVSLK